jgi:hypothetical protein
MSTTNYDFSVFNGDRLVVIFVARDENNNRINVSGYTARGKVRSRYSSTGTLFALSPTIHPTSGVSGIVNLTVGADTLSGIPEGKFPYSIELIPAGGAESGVQKLVRGSFIIGPEVTY